ncbi:response regulator transcription factor [Streptomyces zaomyceticus]|uniref:response regulator transcription factor n=1 Tax=Streptomyces zaomyceticus TaxID=68286 RepID=UPI00371834A5
MRRPGPASHAPAVDRDQRHRHGGERPDRVHRPRPLVGRGLSDGEIAERLHISAATAKAHVARLFTELEAHDRVQRVILAYEAGPAP